MQRQRRTRLAGGAATAVAVLLALPFGAVAGGERSVGAPPVSVATVPTLPPLPTLEPLPPLPGPLPTLEPLPTLDPLPTLEPLPMIPPLPGPLLTLEPPPTLGPLPALGPLPSVGPSPSDDPEPRSTPSASETPSETRTPSPSLTTSPTRDDDPRPSPTAATTVAAKTSPTDQDDRKHDNADGSPPEETDNGDGPLTASSLVLPGLVGMGALAGALALSHLFGIGLGALGGFFSAIAARLDRRAGRHVRAVVAAVPGIGRRGLRGPEGEDPIVAAVNPPLLARNPGSK